jgi:hypothetical protein
MPSPRGLAAAAVAALTLVSLATAADEGEKYPIWWSPRLQLESLDKIDERLNAPLWPLVDGVEVFKGRFKGDGSARKKAIVNNCVSLFRLRKEDYDAGSSSDRRFLNYQRGLCRAVIAFRRARPAKASHIRDFVFDADAVNYLPAMVLIGGGCDWRCRQYEANERRIPVARFSEITKLRVVTEIAIFLETEWSKDTLEIVGRADFNGDGLEDLMVFSTWRAVGGTGGYADYFILGRESPDAVFHVLDADERLCKVIECTPPYDQPPALREGD